MGDRRHARRGRHAADVRRRARLSGTRPALVVRRAPSRQRAGCVAHVDPRTDGARRRTRARARPLVTARAGVHGRALERGALALVLRRRRRRPLPGGQHLRGHRGRRVLPVSARRAAAVAVLARRAGAGYGDRRLRRGGSLGAGRGRRARVHEAVAGYDARAVRRSAALHRHVLVAVSGSLVAWRLRERERRRPVVLARPFRRHHQGRRQAPRAGRGGDDRRRPPLGTRSGRDRCPRRAEGRSIVGVRRSRTRRRAPTTCCATELVGVRGRPRSARRSSPRRCDSPPRCRRRAARRCCGARSARSRRGSEPGDLSGLEDPGALDAIRRSLAVGERPS